MTKGILGRKIGMTQVFAENFKVKMPNFGKSFLQELN
jgi:ribosomal protein L3